MIANGTDHECRAALKGRASGFVTSFLGVCVRVGGAHPSKFHLEKRIRQLRDNVGVPLPEPMLICDETSGAPAGLAASAAYNKLTHAAVSMLEVLESHTTNC